MFTVLLSVYYKESPLYLSQSLSSIWDDQYQKPGQIVLVKDGPLTLDLNAVIDDWVIKIGDIITVVDLPNNIGLAGALNKGLQCCRFDLVARMDTDDIAVPERFKLQIEFMNAHSEVAVSSGFIEEWNIDFTAKVSSRYLPLAHNEIVEFAKLRSPISHPASIFRKSVILDVGGYEDIYPEDHLLWIRVIQKGYKLANIPDVLLRMRTGEEFVARRGYNFLKGELASYWVMYRSGFLSIGEYIKASILRSLVRLAPKFVKLWLYKNMR